VNSKSKTFLVILGTLIIGMLLGGLGYSVVLRLRMNRLHAMLGPDMFSERLLHAAQPLSNAEFESAKKIISETGKQIHATIETSRSQMDLVVDSMVVRLDSVLNDQQMMRLRREIGTLRSGPPPRPGGPPRGPGRQPFGRGNPPPPPEDRGAPHQPGNPPPEYPPPDPQRPSP